MAEQPKYSVMEHAFITALKDSIQKGELFSPKDKLLLAVSGGRDSMCLLHALHKIHVGEIEVAHVNYKLRGKDSDEDEKLVQSYCQQNNIPFHRQVADLSDQKNSIQEVAREIRYNWLGKLVGEKSIQWIVTAHHLDDQMETVLQRLIRGTGLKGLLGIPEKTDRLVRPMLRVHSDLITSYQKDMKVPYRQDVSNFSNDYTRNFIRNKVLGPLTEYYKDLPFGFQTSISNFKNDYKLQKDLVQYWAIDNIVHKEKYYYLAIEEIDKINGKETLLYHILEGKLPINFIQQLLSSESNGLKFDQDNFSILRDRGFIIIRPYKHVPANVVVNGIGEYTFSAGAITLKKCEDIRFSKDNNIEYVRIKKEDFPLKIRNWQKGDAFQPLGMNGNTKQLSDFFIDEKIHAFEKEEIPILANAKDEIIWIVGQRLDERFKIVGNTNQENTYNLTFSKITQKPVPQIFKHLS